MRKYKFRVWDKKTSLMYSNDVVIYSLDMNNLFSYKYPELNKRVVIMQWTGLTDKNGTDIYGGDIVKFGTKSIGYNSDNDYRILQIAWSDKLGAWVFDDGDRDFYRTWNAYIYSDREVIGNIHENPELLEE